MTPPWIPRRFGDDYRPARENPHVFLLPNAMMQTPKNAKDRQNRRRDLNIPGASGSNPRSIALGNHGI